MTILVTSKPFAAPDKLSGNPQCKVNSMTFNNVWQLVPRSEAQDKIISGKWVFKVKDDGTYKAIWVARGFREPLDSDQTIFADVIHNVNFRMLFAMAANNRPTHP